MMRVVDPLDTTVPVPGALLKLWRFEHCTCQHGAYAEHAHDCRMLPTMADTVDATGIYPPHVRTNKAWWDRRWVCISEFAHDGDAIFPHHIGGEINGPVHFCPFQRRVVSPDE